jgi:hypothetical protein
VVVVAFGSVWEYVYGGGHFYNVKEIEFEEGLE